ncbi:hypothetical protein [Paraburkholderia sp. BCC1886]|uniref:hypothetical protein n=1 Tax=Paraburkholderia sp. BCC1886 TaxID=2562670 RepID=UPI0011821BFC|nr:hypothetical protein [Paraburkholderia sp. BCC1886]
MQRIYSLWSALLGIVIVATSIYGGFHYFSPIPYWDQWNGYIGFYHAIVDGDYKFFWSQHMDHRIVFPRVLFFLDIWAFGGWNIFNIVSIYFMLACIGATVWIVYRNGPAQRYSPFLIVGLIGSFLFSWIQNENLKWGFQTQFVAVYLFAVLAFAFYSKPTGSMSRVALGVLFCTMAELSMGNGIATYYAMAMQGVLLRRSWREVLTVVVAGVIANAVYLYHFVKPVMSFDPAVNLVPLERLRFFLIFIGNPLFFINNSLALAGAGGLLVFAFAAWATISLYFKKQFTPYRAFLLVGYAFIVASAIGATQGRWMLGLYAAVSSRYTFPVLLGFLLMSLLAIDLAKTKRAHVLVILVPLVLLSFLVKFQRNVNGDTEVLFQWKLAVLAQKIGLDRPKLDNLIFPPDVHYVYEREAKFAAENQIGPYSRGWLHDAGLVRFDKDFVDATRCAGFLESTHTDDTGIVASGWVVPHITTDRSLLVVMVNGDGQTVGYGVSGRSRPDVEGFIKGAPKGAGWSGFAKAGEKNLSAYALIGDRFCPLETAK